MTSIEGATLHIGFRTSGQQGVTGRGDLELVGDLGGYSAADLEGYRLHIEWPDGIIRDTGLERESADSGKPRLRSQFQTRIQIGRIVAAMLFLPPPYRVPSKVPGGLPILDTKKYLFWQLGFAKESEVTGMMDQVTIVPSVVQVANKDHQDEFGVKWRWARVQQIHRRAEELPDELKRAVIYHRDFVKLGDPVTSKVAGRLDKFHADLAKQGVIGDLLLVAENTLGIAVADGPTLPAPDALSADSPEIKVRAAHQYRLAKSRGLAGRRFSEEVRAAYRHTCAICGAKLSGVDGVMSGVDAAHILAWTTHDLDIVSNGIALCKIHHWAFDSGVIALEFSHGRYSFGLTALAELIDSHSRELLLEAGRVEIPRDRLPDSTSDWPNPQYIDLLYADLGVSVLD